MMTMVICLFPLLLPGTPVLQATPDQPAIAPVQEEQKRPSEVLIGSLTKYYVGVFRATPKWTEHSEKEIQEHMSKNRANIKELVKSGKLVGMAAVSEKSDLKLVAFFKTDDEQEARAIADNSYAVKEGLLKGEICKVWGTRGLGEGLGKAILADPKKQEKHFLTILSRGKAWKDNPDKEMLGLVDVHASNVLKLRESGMLKFYGATDGSGAIRNISILTGQSVKDVQTKLAAGELIKREWFSPAVYTCIVAEGTLP